MRKLAMEEYRKLLLTERESIRREMDLLDHDISWSDTPGGRSELADYDNHPADSGTETFEKEKKLAMRDNYRSILHQIDQALSKIEHGTYGLCDRCGGNIPKRRLDILPYAVYCVECQDAIEGS